MSFGTYFNQFLSYHFLRILLPITSILSHFYDLTKKSKRYYPVAPVPPNTIAFPLTSIIFEYNKKLKILYLFTVVFKIYFLIMY